MKNWNASYLDPDTNEVVYHWIDEVKQSKRIKTVKETLDVKVKPSKRIKTVKETPNVKVKKTKVKKTTERAVYGRVKKILSNMPREINGLSPIRSAYKGLYKEDLKLSTTNKNRLLSKYNNIYENLIFIRGNK